MVETVSLLKGGAGSAVLQAAEDALEIVASASKIFYIIPAPAMASPHAAITAALAAYDRVMIPAGTWAVNSTLVIPSGKVLLGAPGCTITTAISAIISMTNCFETRLSGFKIIGSHAGTSHQIVLTDCTYCEVDLTFENGNSGLNLIRSDFCKISLVAREMRGNGIRLSGAQYNEIRLLEGRNISNFGIYVAKDGDRASTGNSFYAEKKCIPEFLTAYQTSVVATSAGPNPYWYPEANRIGLEGLGITPGNDGNIIVGAIISDTNDNGISVSSSKNTGSNLLITNCDHDGLHLYGSQNSFAGVTSIGNRMSGAGIGSSSVPEAFAQGNTITALVATGNEMYGLNLSSQADGNVVSGSLVGNDLGEIGNSASGSNFVNGAGSSPIIDTGSWEEVTSAPGGVVSATQTLITLNLAPGSQVTQVNFTGGKRPIIVLRNYTNSIVTIVHNSSFLRLTRKTDLVLKQNQAIMLVKVSGAVWQEIGAEWTGSGGAGIIASDVGDLSYSAASLQNRVEDDYDSPLIAFERAKGAGADVTSGGVLGKLTYAGEGLGLPRYAFRDTVFVESVSGAVVRGKRKWNVTDETGGDWTAFTFSADGYMGIGDPAAKSENTPSVSLDVNGQAAFRVFGGTSWQNVTSVVDGTITVERSLIAFNIPTDTTISIIVGPAMHAPNIKLRNYGAGKITLAHGASSLRLPGGSNVVIPTHHEIEMDRVSGNIWQMVGLPGFNAVSTVAAIPSAATAGVGARRMVTDASATTFASIVAGGGTNVVPVYSDGTNWRIG